MELVKMQRYESYRDSGVDWIGEIPQNWGLKRLKFIAFMQSGETIRPEDFTEKGYPVFGGNGFRGYTGRYTNEGEHILIGRQGALCGNVNYAKGKFFASEHAIVVYPLRGESISWLGEAIRVSDLNRYSQSAAQPGIAVNVIKEVSYPYPSLSEQTAIANFLDQKTAQIEEAIAIKEQQIGLLKERKQIIIQKAVTQGLNPNVPMKDSGVEWIGKVPKHWGVKKLRYLGKTQNGISAGAEYFGSGYPFISYGDVYNSVVLPSTVNGLANSSEQDQIQYSIKEGDVLFTRTSETVEEIGFASTCFKSIDKATFAGFLIRFRPSSTLLIKEFSRYYFSSQLMRKYFVKEMNLVIRASLSQELLKNLPVLLPPIGEQLEIFNYLEEQSRKFESLIDIQKSQIEKLKEYKTTLINSAVTGKIKVTDEN